MAAPAGLDAPRTHMHYAYMLQANKHISVQADCEHTPGALIAAARAAAGLTLARVGEALGVSVPYVHDLERDRRRLTWNRWRALAAVLPELDLQAFAEATVRTGEPVRIDPSALTDAQRAPLVAALLAAAGVAAPATQAAPERPVQRPAPVQAPLALTSPDAPPTRQRRAKREPSEPTGEQRLREAYTAGILAGAPGQAFSLPAGKLGSILGPAMRAHAAGLEGEAAYTWLRETAATYRRETAASAAYQSGWAPHAFARWLNARRTGNGVNPNAQPVPATGRLWKAGPAA